MAGEAELKGAPTGDIGIFGALRGSGRSEFASAVEWVMNVDVG
jgi:hypothetical protein